MALDFPTSPTDGQIYDNYYWDNTNSVWRLLSDSLEIAANFSNTATGTYTSGYDYKYISFTADGTLTVTRGGYADVLLVGGGGAGGGADGVRLGGGGGAGGFLEVNNYYLSAGNHDVVVGAGGTIGVQRNIAPTGESSRLGALYALGGSGGAYPLDTLIGGSAGGVGNDTSGSFNLTPGQGTPGQGNAGGGSPNVSAGAGGGGGASAAGQAGATNQGGAGGDGRSSSITGSSVTYAGGGGGAGSAAGAGGAGGGGAGSTTGDATDGTANTGGGGGGAYNGFGGLGGSGIVIVRVRTN